jgi:hypothetical protein
MKVLAKGGCTSVKVLTKGGCQTLELRYALQQSK